MRNKNKGAITLTALLTTVGLSFTVILAGVGFLAENISENAEQAEANQTLITDNKVDIAINQTEIYTTKEDIDEIKTDVKDILKILRNE